MSPEFLIALTGIITALITGSIALYNARHAARKDLVDTLQEETERLGQRIQILEQEKTARSGEYDKLLQRVFILEADNATLKLRIVTLEADNVRLVTENRKLQVKIGDLEDALLQKQDRSSPRKKASKTIKEEK
jgi:chaperonin cofactor prefoldin